MEWKAQWLLPPGDLSMRGLVRRHVQHLGDLRVFGLFERIVEGNPYDVLRLPKRFSARSWSQRPHLTELRLRPARMNDRRAHHADSPNLGIRRRSNR